jgi:hypothetical protein
MLEQILKIENQYGSLTSFIHGEDHDGTRKVDVTTSRRLKCYFL